MMEHMGSSELIESVPESRPEEEEGMTEWRNRFKEDPRTFASTRLPGLLAAQAKNKDYRLSLVRHQE